MNVPVHLLISIEEGLRRELEVLRDTTHGNAGRDNILTSLEQCKIRLLDLKRYVNSGVNDTDLDAFYRNHPNTLLRVKGELEKMNYGYNNPTYGATASFQNVVQPQNVGWSNMQRVQPQMYPQDRYENMGAQLVKEVATKTNDIAGDGTTTANISTSTTSTRVSRHTGSYTCSYKNTWIYW